MTVKKDMSWRFNIVTTAADWVKKILKETYAYEDDSGLILT